MRQNTLYIIHIKLKLLTAHIGSPSMRLCRYKCRLVYSSLLTILKKKILGHFQLLFRRHIINDGQPFSGPKIKKELCLMKILESLFTYMKRRKSKSKEIVYLDGNTATKIHMKNIGNLNFSIPPKPMKLQPKF